MTERNTFWAIRNDSLGFHCGTWLTRIEAIAGHVDGRYRFHKREIFIRHLSKEQTQDWQKCRRTGDRAVRVVVREAGE